MFISELQTKDIVSVKNGANLGRIVDAKIDDNGNITEFIAQEKKLLKKVSPNGEVTFTFTCIKKIGSDVILIDN